MTRAHAPLRGALRVRMADGTTCHADELADALAGLTDALDALDRPGGADALPAALDRLVAAAGEAVAVARALGVVVPVEAEP